MSKSTSDHDVVPIPAAPSPGVASDFIAASFQIEQERKRLAVLIKDQRDRTRLLVRQIQRSGPFRHGDHSFSVDTNGDLWVVDVNGNADAKA